MQRFPCPFCGLRDEREFHFAGEAGNTRPAPSAGQTPQAQTPQAWAEYLYMEDNPRGRSREVWVHTPCQEYFILTRDTLSMQVLGSEQLRRDRP